MSTRRKQGNIAFQSAHQSMSAADIHWIEIFKDRVADRLKEVLQEDMDWMTSLPILERLNRLYEVEKTRNDDGNSSEDR